MNNKNAIKFYGDQMKPGRTHELTKKYFVIQGSKQ